MNAPLSPGREAWRRLCRNRLALASMVVLAVIAGAVALSPWIAPYDPARQHLWIGAQPPGFAHPDVADENAFAVGAPARSSAAVVRAREVEIVASAPASDYRIVLARGVVRSITRGTEEFARLDLAGKRGVELLEGDRPGAERSGGVLAVGEAPPAGWLAPGQRVLLLRVADDRAAQRWRIALEGGVVRALSVDGQPAQEALLRAEDVRAVVADGEPLRLRHLLGTDRSGRDVLSRVLHGGRISLLVGAIATLVSLVIGVVYGAVSGYVGGRTDRAMMSTVDVLYCLPFMFLVIALIALFGSSLLLLFTALGAVQWLTMARIVRGQVLTLSAREFVHAARLCGAGHWTVIRRHLIPNALGPIIVYTTLTVPMVIMEESFLAYLGLSVHLQGSDVDSWGAQVKYGVDNLGTSWLLLAPATAMALTLISLNSLGDGLRDALDPQLKGRT